MYHQGARVDFLAPRQLTIFMNVITKEGRYISMKGHTEGNIGDIEKFKEIFKTIDLEPKL